MIVNCDTAPAKARSSPIVEIIKLVIANAFSLYFFKWIIDKTNVEINNPKKTKA